VGIVRRLLPFIIVVLVTACTFPPLQTPPHPPPRPPTPSPSPTPDPTPTPTPVPTPDQGAIPRFAAGELVETTIAGMRVRARPGSDGRVIAGLLPFGAVLQVAMGPIPVDDFGWYLLTDNGSGAFGEGWIAAGYEPEPFLRSTGASATSSAFVHALAATGDAEYGPIPVETEGDYAIRWVAVDPEAARCTFAVSIAAGGADPVPAIRATLGGDLVPGTLQPSSFDALGVRGQVFVTVESDCAWSLVVVRVPEATPEPSPSP